MAARSGYARPVWVAPWSLCALCATPAAGGPLFAALNGRGIEIFGGGSLVTPAMLTTTFAVVASFNHLPRGVQRFTNRTLVYDPLTVSLAPPYAACAGLLRRAFVSLTGSRTQPAVVASALAIAALFNPLRRRMQGFVDHRFHKAKYDARRTLEAYAAKLGRGPDLGTLGGGLVLATRETVQPAHA